MVKCGVMKKLAPSEALMIFTFFVKDIKLFLDLKIHGPCRYMGFELGPKSVSTKVLVKNVEPIALAVDSKHFASEATF